MKNCHFNSWIAKTFLAPGYKAITIFCHSFFKQKREDVKPADINHECIHQYQQLEMQLVGLFLGIILVAIFKISLWWVLLTTFALFYAWYGIEYLLIVIFGGYKRQNDRYHDVAFEEEAHSNDENFTYIDSRRPFSWIHYLKIKSYKR